MKQTCLFISTFIILFASSQSFGKTPYGMAGCGLGSVIFGPKNGQVSAATTNQSSLNQIFGITSGTSNCVENNKAVAEAAQENFIKDNFATLSKEIAQGDGEALKAFSDTFGCDSATYSVFARELQASYDDIFSAPGSLAALEVIQDNLQSNESAVKGCAFIL